MSYNQAVLLIRDQFKTDVRAIEEGELPFLVVEREKVVRIVRVLREDLIYTLLIDITAIDNLKRTPHPPERFTMVYKFHSIHRKERIGLKTYVPESDPIIDSIFSLYKGANWLEREVFDMFGIRFRGHSDLRRILMYESFKGHPLRKDYPLDQQQPLIPPRRRSVS